MVPRNTTKTKVPKIKIEVSFIYFVRTLLNKKDKSKFPFIKKYNNSANMGSAIPSPIIGAR